MATHRDDLNDTAFASDGMRVHQRARVEDTARMSEAVFMSLSTLVSDRVLASDGPPQEQATAMAAEAAFAGDEITQALFAANLGREVARVSEKLATRLRTLIEDGATAIDSASGLQGVLSIEAARVSDVAFGSNLARSLASDTAKVRDFAQVVWRDVLQDHAAASDSVLGRARVRTLAQDTAFASAGAVANADSVYMARDSARAWDEVRVLNLRARTLVSDGATAEDSSHQSGSFGQAWTSNTDTWAMSRYAPFTFTTLAVVDGVLVGCGEGGVYALDGRDERIAAVVRTGKLDMTGHVLAIPVEAHLEYALSGTASVDVTTTQSGEPKTYSYPLKGRPLADDLTNARAEFGRGLRGRHFAYTLRLAGERAHINDWSVLVAASKRSI